MPLKAVLTLAHMHRIKKDDERDCLRAKTDGRCSKPNCMCPPKTMENKMNVILEVESIDPPGACPHEIEAIEVIKTMAFAIQHNLAVMVLSERMALKMMPVLDKWLADNGYKSMHEQMAELKANAGVDLADLPNSDSTTRH